MRFELYNMGEKFNLEVERQDEYDIITHSGRKYKVRFFKLSDDTYIAEVDGRRMNLEFLQENPDSLRILLDGEELEYSYTVQKRDEKRLAKLVSPLPGRVIDVKVRSGEEVSLGDELIIIESMKMQTVIRSDREGVVEEVHVKAGETIKRGQVLITFKV